MNQNYNYISLKLTSLIILIIILFTLPVKSQESSNDFIVGLRGGYTKVFGYYESQLSGAGFFGIYGLYTVPQIYKYFMAEADITYSMYPLNKSQNSHLNILSFSIGPNVYYPFISFSQIYGGISIKGNYLNLEASRLNRTQKALKPGIAFKSGIFLPLKWGLRTRLGCEYNLSTLSSKPFSSICFFGGVSFNYNAFVRKDDSFKEDKGEIMLRINALYDRGLMELKMGKIDEAKKSFNKILSLDNNNKDAKAELDTIKQAEDTYAEALNYVKEKKYYDAIPYLEKSGKYIINAREELKTIRDKMHGDIAGLEKNGIAAYDQKDYKTCVIIMKRILLIDPNNSVAKLYLPRAQKRYEALKKLQ